jgi:hypothetical protein
MQHTPVVMRRQNGSTLLEALIAIAILTTGIITVMAMQTRAIGTNSMAANRTEANNVALAILETLKGLPFSDANLVATGATDQQLLGLASVPIAPGAALQALVVGDSIRTFTAVANFPQMGAILQVPDATTAGIVQDNTGHMYTLGWAIQDGVMPDGSPDTRNKKIWLFMFWTSFMGENHLCMTTVKNYGE